MKNQFNYTLTVKYKEGYFENPSTPLVRSLNFSSTSERSKEYIQGVYPHCKILKVESVS